jgi:hypothetical protein
VMRLHNSIEPSRPGSNTGLFMVAAIVPNEMFYPAPDPNCLAKQ